MGLLNRLFEAASPRELSSISTAAREALPNSFDPKTDHPARLVVNSRRIRTRNLDEIIGMCRMALVHGAVDDAQAHFLLAAIESNLYATTEWPGNILRDRLLRALADGRIDPDEESELLALIAQVAGSRSDGGPPVSGAIPFDDPMPSIVYQNRGFVLTGQFALGPRRDVASIIENRGGAIKSSCSGKTQYLIVGTFGSDEWLHSTHGTKILKAIELKEAGQPLAIVAERTWAESLGLAGVATT